MICAFCGLSDADPAYLAYRAHRCSHQMVQDDTKEFASRVAASNRAMLRDMRLRLELPAKMHWLEMDEEV